MSRTEHPNITADDRAERRARRRPRPPVRRTGTRAGVIAAELRDAVSLDDFGLVYPTWNPTSIVTEGI